MINVHAPAGFDLRLEGANSHASQLEVAEDWLLARLPEV
jgi:hypothetical protein